MLTILPLSALGETLPVVGGNPVLPLMAQETRRHCVVTITGSRQAVLMVPGSSVEVCAKQTEPEAPSVKPAEKPSMPAAKKAQPRVVLPKTPVPKAGGEQVEESHKRPRKTSPFDSQVPYRPWVHLPEPRVGPEPRDQRRPTPVTQRIPNPSVHLDFSDELEVPDGVHTDATVLTNAGVHREFDAAEENPGLVRQVMQTLNVTLEEAKEKVRRSMSKSPVSKAPVVYAPPPLPQNGRLTAILPVEPKFALPPQAPIVMDLEDKVEPNRPAPKGAKTFAQAFKLAEGDCDFQPNNQDEEFCGTLAEPGSPEKIDVFIDRLRNGWPLWHPDDPCRYSDLLELFGRELED